jgi:hypothetical protein
MSASPASSISGNTEFWRFADLPPELRDEIWLHCLPHRVEEFDVAQGKAFYHNHRNPDRLPLCTLAATTYLNFRPPLITQVCREARDIAFKTGSYEEYKPVRAPKAYWVKPGDISLSGKIWRSRSSPKLVHLNWDRSYSLHGYYSGYSGQTDPLRCLEHTVLMRSSRGSMMKNYLSTSIGRDRLEVFDQHQQWLVVMHLVVIHAPTRIVAESGLFGLLGDAPIQIVEVANVDEIEAMYKFAEQCYERTRGLCKKSEFRRSGAALEKYLNHLLTPAYGPDRVPSYATSIRAAVMFRVCHQNCSPPDPPPMESGPVGDRTRT